MGQSALAGDVRRMSITELIAMLERHQAWYATMSDEWRAAMEAFPHLLPGRDYYLKMEGESLAAQIEKVKAIVSGIYLDR